MARQIVIDASIALAFVMDDEDTAKADAVLDLIVDGAVAHVPSHWFLEVGNALLMAERRARGAAEAFEDARTRLTQLPVLVDGETASRALAGTTILARQHGLTLYDGAYLELALRLGAQLATLDRQLAKAGASIGVSVF